MQASIDLEQAKSQQVPKEEPQMPLVKEQELQATFVRLNTEMQQLRQ